MIILFKQTSGQREVNRGNQEMRQTFLSLRVKSIIQTTSPSPAQYSMFGPISARSKMWSKLIKRNIDDGYFTNDFRRESLDALSVGTLPN